MSNWSNASPRFAAIGCVVGGFVAAVALALESQGHGLLAAHTHSPLLFITDSAPLILGAVGQFFSKRDRAYQQALRDLRLQLDDCSSLADTIFEKSGHAILVANRIGIIQTVNPALCAMLGYEPAELVGNSVLMLHDQSEIEKHSAILGVSADFQGLTQPIREGKKVRVDCEFICKDGQRMILDITAAARTQDGELIGFILIGGDVTEARHQADTIAEMSEQLGTMNKLLRRQHHELTNANTKLEELALVDDLTGVGY